MKKQLCVGEVNDEKKEKKDKDRDVVLDFIKISKLNAMKKQLCVGEVNDEKKEKKDKDRDVVLDFIKISKNDLKQFEYIYKQLMEWIDVEKDKKLFNINIWYNLQKGLMGKVLQIINDKINSNNKDDKPSKDQIEMKMKIYKKYLPNEFAFLVEQIELDLYKKFPK
eukprot:225086_1